MLEMNDITLSLLSSLSISLIITLLALFMGQVMRFHNFASCLWILVLVKLLIPSLIVIDLHKISESIDLVLFTRDVNVHRNQLSPFIAMIITVYGSIFILIRSLSRMLIFNRLLKSNSVIADERVQEMNTVICLKMGIKHKPQVYELNGNITPMVWFMDRQVRIYLSANYLAKANNEEIYWILAHELAHVKRKDHFMRILEWLVTILFWWNPFIWIAKHHLRMEEEICCDQYVIKKLSISVRDYVSVLLSAIKNIVNEQKQKLPAIACSINRKGIIRRFGMLLKEKPKGLSRTIISVGLFIIVLILLPLSIRSMSSKGHFIFNEENEDWLLTITLSSSEPEQKTLIMDGIRFGDVDKIANQMDKMYQKLFAESSKDVQYEVNFSVRVNEAVAEEQEGVKISVKEE